MALSEKRVLLLGIMLAIAFLVDARVPFAGVWQNFCWGSNEMNTHPYLVEDAFIDVYTQRGGKGLSMQSDAFRPEEIVILYAKVADNTVPVPNEGVAFAIRGPRNPYRNFSTTLCAETNASGIASTSFRIPLAVEHLDEVFGIWNIVATVDLGGQVICDTLIFEVGWIVEIISVVTGTFLETVYWIPRGSFTKDKLMDVKLTVKNIAFTSKSVWFAVVCYDEERIPISAVGRVCTLSGKAIEEIFFQSISIPKWASLGTATVYASAYDGPPSEGSRPYCLEKSAEILIMEGIEDAISPSINDAFREPEVVQPHQEVIVSANVTDSESGVQGVNLCYRIDDSSKWANVKMNKTVGDTFAGSIPGFPPETNVIYVVIAYDYAGNFAVDDKAGQYYVFTVIPESSSIHVLLLIIVITTTVIAKKKSHYLLV